MRSAPTSATSNRPLLVSVRSGARASMPGMMDTILNLGLNDKTVEGLAARSEATAASPTTATAASSRCMPTSCLGVDHGVFEDMLENFKNLNGFAERHRALRRRLGRDHRGVQGRGREPSSASRSRRIPTSSSTARSRRCSAPGRTRAPRPIAGCTTFPRTGAPPSPFRRWCSATSARRAPPASPSRAIPRRARRRSTASSSQRAGRGRRRRHPHAAAA